MGNNYPENMSTEDRRYAYLEGKIWALDHLLGFALKEAGVRDPRTLNEILDQALDGYPGAQLEGPIRNGVQEIFQHVHGHISER